MTTFNGENGFVYGNHYLEKCPNMQTIELNSSTNSEVKCEEVTANSQSQEKDSKDEPEVDIMINNVVCSFNVRCHLNLRQIALTGTNVEYRRENGMVTMKLRNPYTTASIWSSGKITCTGATSDIDAKIASRKFARILQQLGFRVKFANYRVVNVLGTCSMPFGINLNKFAEKNRPLASFEPELHPGATYRIKDLKGTLKIFTTGSITITAPSVQNVRLSVEHVYPLVYECKTAKPPPKELNPLRRKRQPAKQFKMYYSDEDDLSDDDFLSDFNDMSD